MTAYLLLSRTASANPPEQCATFARSINLSRDFSQATWEFRVHGVYHARERGAIGAKLFTFCGCRSARGLPPGWVWGRVVAYAACARAWGFPASSGSKSFGGSWSRAIERKGPCLYVCTDGSARACGVGDCARLIPTLGNPRETSGPRIDRIPPTRPSWWDRQYRELKKLIFLGPSKCPIDLFGPVANGTILKRLHRLAIAC